MRSIDSVRMLQPLLYIQMPAISVLGIKKPCFFFGRTLSGMPVQLPSPPAVLGATIATAIPATPAAVAVIATATTAATS